MTDSFIKFLKTIHINAEKSSMGGYWVELSWDYDGSSQWEYFPSEKSAWTYLDRNGRLT